MLHALLAASTGRGEYAALVDTKDAFDACSAASVGVELSKLVWVRCGGNAEHALRAADLLIQAGGFGVVALDLAEATPAALNRIPPTAWFRFRRAVESTPTILTVIADHPLAKSCSSMTIKMPPRRAVFTGQRAVPFITRRRVKYVCLHSWAGCQPAGGFLFSLRRDGGREDRRVLRSRPAAGRRSKHVPAQVAVAATAEAAILAARNLPGYTFIPPGEEARVLGALSIDALPPDPELFETFHLWGIRSLADLARLPDDALASRLGARGLWLQRLARGAFERPLRPRLPAAIYEESADLDHPIKLREPLLFLIARFLHDLTARLKSQSLAAAALHLTLNGNQRRHSLPFPDARCEAAAEAGGAFARTPAARGACRQSTSGARFRPSRDASSTDCSRPPRRNRKNSS